MRWKRLFRWCWAIVGRLILYGFAVIVTWNIWLHFQMEHHGQQRFGRRGGWRGDREPSQRTVPPIRSEYDASIRAQLKHYPLRICLVDGKALDHHGEPVDYDHQGMLIRLCSEDCVRDFRTDPAHFSKSLLEASLAQ
jgi:hypothetical protein